MFGRPAIGTLCAVLLAFQCGCFLSPPPVGPDLGGALRGPVVVVPYFVSEGKRARLRSLLAWPEKPVQVRTPYGRVLEIEVVPATGGVLLTETGSGRTASGGYNAPIRFELEDGALEFTVEYP